MQKRSVRHRTGQMIPRCAVFAAGMVDVGTFNGRAAFFAMGANVGRRVLHAIVNSSLLGGVSHDNSAEIQSSQTPALLKVLDMQCHKATENKPSGRWC